MRRHGGAGLGQNPVFRQLRESHVRDVVNDAMATTRFAMSGEEENQSDTETYLQIRIDMTDGNTHTHTPTRSE